MTTPAHNYLFNFSSSYTGGGLIILKSYLELFEKKGGATFILNDKLKDQLSNRYQKNKILFVKISKIKRFFNDEYYLTPIKKMMGPISLYFSYGIPIYSKVAKNNWFHVSNLIPVNPRSNYLNPFSMLQMHLLGHRIKKNSFNIDILSADSQDGIDQTQLFLQERKIQKTKVLKNGLNGSFVSAKNSKKENCAVTIGTQRYKDLDRLYKVFKRLQEQGEVDSLKIIGGTETIPKYILKDKKVRATGFIDHNEAINELANSKIYLSTSLIENSSIASLEGLYLCNKSYLSTIGSHLELIMDVGIEHKKINLQELGELYQVTEEVPEEYIKSISWDNVNEDFYQYLSSRF